jgi:hypothetical protein
MRLWPALLTLVLISPVSAREPGESPGCCWLACLLRDKPTPDELDGG